MRAVVQHRYGTPTDTYRLEDVPRPRAGGGRVVVRVRAAGVDPGVWHLTTGVPYLARLGAGLRRPRVAVPGHDLAGVVEEVGDVATDLRPGDAVLGVASGTFAELARPRADRLVRVPEGLSFEEAAALPTSAVTALAALRAVRLEAGDHVAVLGAGGGVGAMVTALAVARGAKVTGVCSATKADLVRGLGAHDVVDYARSEITDAGVRFDAVVDTAGNRPLPVLREALTETGRLVVVGGDGAPGRWLAGFQRGMKAAALSPFTRQTLRMLVATTTPADLAEVARLAGEGVLRPVVDRTYPLERAAEAVEHVGSGHARGKVVVVL